MTNRSLFAVVFEVKPNAERSEDYLRIAASLRPPLQGMPGFLANERYRSRSRPDYLLSLSLWDDEKALVRWRSVHHHHEAQSSGRQGVLDDYRIRVGEATRVAGPYADRTVGWMRWDETEVGPERALTLVEGVARDDSAVWKLASDAGGETFDHLAEPGRMATLTGWKALDDAQAFADEAMRRNDAGVSVYAIRVIRDYGMRDRREAPQFHE